MQVGEVRAVTGSVMASLASGFDAAVPGTALHAGNSILVGPKSSVAMSFGTACEVEASENSTIQIQPTETEICVAVSGSNASTTVASVAVDDRPFLPGLLPATVPTIPLQFIPATMFIGAAVSATALSTGVIFPPPPDPVSAQ